MSPNESIYHTWNIPGQPPGAGNIKYKSDDGHHEAVKRPDGTAVMDPANRGSYNYADPKLLLGIPHFVLDMLPYYLLGNTPDDPTTARQRIMRWFEGAE
jgi:hypothetical protein